MCLKKLNEFEFIEGMEVAMSAVAMRLTTLASLSLVSLTSLTAAADEPACPPGAFCEEVENPAPAEDEAPPDEIAEEAVPQEVDLDEAPSPEPRDEPATSAPLDSELDDWEAGGEPTSDAPSYGDPVVRAGIGIFGASYMVPFVTGLVAALIVEDAPEAAPLIPLMLPVAGPLITGAIYEASPGVWGMLGATSGVQALGLLIIAVGATMDADPLASSAVRPTADGLIVRF